MNKLSETIKDLLRGGDLRSIGEANKIVKLINNQDDFDVLFNFFYSNDRLIVMRVSDSIEKTTRKKKEYLDKHKNEIIELCSTSIDKELKWHLAQIVSRLKLDDEEMNKVFDMLKKWVLNQKESKIVRANALETLSEISKANRNMKEEFNKIVNLIKQENIPSLNARVKKLLS